MLGSFWSGSGVGSRGRSATGGGNSNDGGDTTPRANAIGAGSSNPSERNPFELSLSSSSSSSGGSSTGRVHSRKNSAGSLSAAGTGTGSNVGISQQPVPSGLRTPTLQKSFVLPEITSSVNAHGAVQSHPSTSAASSLHQSPVHSVSGSGRNTPVRAHHSVSPYPQQQSSASAMTASPRVGSSLSKPSTTASSVSAAAGSSSSHAGHSRPAPSHPQQASQQQAQSSAQSQKPPEFKLSQPPDSKHGASPNKDREPGNGTSAAPSHSSVSSPSSATSSASASYTSSASASKPSSSTSTTTVSTSTSRSTATNKISPSSAATGTGTGTASRRKVDTSYLKGKLTVKIMEARGLAAPSADARPYVVATFEQNEFVSREAINEHEEDAKGEPMSPESSSHMRRSQKEAANNSKSKAQSQAAARVEEQPAAASEGQGQGPEQDDKMDTSTASAYNPVWKHEVAFDVTSDNSPVTVCVYDRETEVEAFLGLVDIQPKLSHGWSSDEWHTLHSRQDEPVTGEVRVRISFERSEARRTLRASDFEFLRMIGKGTFGRVFQVRKKDTKRIYAMKVLSKREIIAKKEVQHTIGERRILQRSSECPFLLGLKFSFQSETELFLVMDFKSGGELFHHLQREGRFTEDRARFYAAEITLAFEYLHKYHIVYRDLKPENILLDATGHIVLCDFGLSKPDLPSNALTNTFCGTTEYLAPEVLLDDHGYSQTVDFWSLGVLLFEMCCGWSPFYAEDTQQMYKNICFGKIKFPRGVIGDDGKQFVKGLLNRNPAHRLGSKRDAAELKEHAFFKMIDWEALGARQVTVPFKPFVDSDESVSNFDPEFTEADILKEAPKDNGDWFDDDPTTPWLDDGPPGTGAGNGGARPAPVPINPSRDRMNGTGAGPLDEQAQDAFRGFSYSGDAELHDLMRHASMSEEDAAAADDDMRA